MRIFATSAGPSNAAGTSIDMVPLPCPGRSTSGRIGRRAHTRPARDPAFAALLDTRGGGRAVASGRDASTVGVDLPRLRVTPPTSSVKQTGRGVPRPVSGYTAVDVKEFSATGSTPAGPLLRLNGPTTSSSMTSSSNTSLTSTSPGGRDTNPARCGKEHGPYLHRTSRPLRDADVVVVVIDGADADSGTSWEMGMPMPRRRRLSLSGPTSGSSATTSGST